ncbi:MAG: heme-binding protein [Candidatus Sumerlaeia bacterium]|nr:heme-binding protein [Candidatus Sumerlaeia bacterium]
MTLAKLFMAILLALAAGPASKPADAPPAYGPPITLEQAKTIAAAAEAEAVKNRWDVVIVITDSGANPVLLHRMDNAQLGSLDVAMMKARSAVAFRRSTKVFADQLEAGGAGWRFLKVADAMPIEGGLPIIVGGKIIGGIGVSGMAPNQDGQIAQAGLDALK